MSLLAYKLGNLWRRLALPRGIEKYSLTSLQQRLVKTGGQLVKHARYYWLLLVEGHLTRRRFGAMLGRIALSVPTGWRMVFKPVSESACRGLDEERCARVSQKGTILSCVGMGRRLLGEALQMLIFSHVASRRNRCTIVAVFEVKKEIAGRLLITSPRLNPN